ncbi:hypothetical protein M501DRAFT_941447 [Patellaria atrata CBS 101060]|uniref:E3 ubiquitin-protein ligase listerin n=1 Tax=Patellaria atrata CBS 101060 TaxID=1346257 RepID=A0A9P4S5N6_9PEZI|nr:hypothetical protein M501DRAFT_941447 [Patellaria atrata CBS 101060]
MSRRTPKAQASSSRAVSVGFSMSTFGFSSASRSTFGSVSSPLAYVSEPPDLSAISDPKTIVAFKSLSKKDSTTKAKALDDLQSYTSAGEIEDAVLDAWITIYPRTSIDSLRRVRQSAHLLHGQISASSGKRLAKYMPTLAGPWLASTYDNDKGVSKSALESFNRVFSTPEKVNQVRKAYQKSIIEYCKDVIDKETPHTLSDERSVSPDEAEAKYSRVIASTVLLVASMLSELMPEETLKHQASYSNILGDAKLWGFATYQDPFVRRSVHRLLHVCIERQNDALRENLKLISTSFLSKALNSDQTGSEPQYIEVLIALTEVFPSVWTESYTGKKSATQRLHQFLERGSQGGPPRFWAHVSSLIKSLPRSVLPFDEIHADELADAIRTGIQCKDEPRFNFISAFTAYVEVLAYISASLPEANQVSLAQKRVLPLVSEYIRPLPEPSQWKMPEPQAVPLITYAMSSCMPSSLMRTEWTRISKILIQDISTSLPEQARDFEQSQSIVCEQGRRYATVQKDLFAKHTGSEMQSFFMQTCFNVIKGSLDGLNSRSGKPFGAAGVILALLQHCSQSLFSDDIITRTLATFLKEDLAQIFMSPSCSRLADILYCCSEQTFFETAFSAVLNILLKSPHSESQMNAFRALLTSEKFPQKSTIATSNSKLQRLIVSRLNLCLNGASDWNFLSSVFSHSSNIMAASTEEEVLMTMTQSLTIEDNVPRALNGFSIISRVNPHMLRRYSLTPEGVKFLQYLLFLTESSDDNLSHIASELNTSLHSRGFLDTDNIETKQSMIDLIRNGLHETSHTSISVDTLLDLTFRILQGSDEEKIIMISKIIPEPAAWNGIIEPFLNFAPGLSLAITTQLAGALYLVQETNDSSSLLTGPKINRDANGYSGALRTAIYVVRLLTKVDLFVKLSVQQRSLIYEKLSLSYQLASDNLMISGSNRLWYIDTPESEVDILEFISETSRLTHSWLQSSSDWWTGDGQDSEYAFIDFVHDCFLDASSNTTPSSFYNARAYATAIAELIEIHGCQQSKATEVEEQLRAARRSTNAISTAAFLSAYHVPCAKSKTAARFCGELVADLTSPDAMKPHAQGLEKLVLLNCLIQSESDLRTTIAKQRIIFLIKNLALRLKEQSVPDPMKAEICRAFAVLLPLVRDVYGSHWTDLFDFLTQTWLKIPAIDSPGTRVTESCIPLLHYSLKLFSVLRSLKDSDDANDDLADVWKEYEDSATKGLLHCLTQSQHIEDESHQPMKITNELLARQISHLPSNNLPSSKDLFPLLYVNSQPLQMTAYNALHKTIPAAQEQISFDAALDNRSAKLPEELLSLILNAPTMASLDTIDLERNVPLPLRGYLLSWLLVFDHFQYSSFKVKSDYFSVIKEGDYLQQLLDFIFDFLGHSRGRPIDVSKFNISSYSPSESAAENCEKDIQHFLTHLYYLCLSHLPSLVKGWWIECKSRATVLTVESWTEKYISPLVITTTLSSVSEWATHQDTTVDDGTLNVRISYRAREITASYEVDEQNMQILIALPSTYPLHTAAVRGINRVAVDERKWQAWLNNVAGVIAFSNGNVVDGLVAWRRNVTGALKGQSECAICYSIISAEKTLPGKRCGTCKNLFHASCLLKWFKTSNASSCPLCRNPFNYG